MKFTSRFLSKIFLPIVVITFIFTSELHSQSGWFWQHPYPQGDYIEDMCFINKSTGWAVTSYQILKTTNSGSNWSIKYNKFGYFLSVYFINENTGWTGGYDSLYKTTDGGNNWFVQHTYMIGYETIYDIYFQNSQTGFYVTQEGIYKTTNSGVNWNWKLYNLDGQLRSFSFINNSTGWVCGDSGKFYKTTNDGENWFRQNSGIPEVLSQVSFVDSLIGYACGNHGTFLKTTNGGYNWSRNTTFTSTYSFEFCKFANQNTGWIGYSLGNGGVIRKTTNGGNTWDSTFTARGIKNIFLIDSLHLFSSGIGIIKTTDGGNWFSVSFGITSTLSTGFFINENTGWIAGGGDGFSNYRGVLLKTSDGGQTWAENPNFDYNKINSVFFINQNTGWVAGINSTIKKTTDGGSTWQSIVPPAAMRYTKILFADSLNGWLTGYNEFSLNTNIYKSTDGGLNWFSQFNGYNFEITTLCFFNSQTGYAGGGWGEYQTRILKTTNGGVNWNQLNTTTYFKVNHLTFLNENTGWAGGDRTGTGFIIKTTNSGQNWNIPADTITSGSVTSITFLDSLKGLATIDYGSMFLSTDGGLRWKKTFTGSQRTSSMYFVNNNTGWAFGVYGTILKTTNGGSVFVNNNSLVVPEGYELFQNYPNPFNPSTTIEYSISKESRVSIIVYDITGREIETLVNEVKRAGYYTVQFNASRLSSGIYFYRITSGDFVQTKKMVLIK